MEFGFLSPDSGGFGGAGGPGGVIVLVRSTRGASGGDDGPIAVVDSSALNFDSTVGGASGRTDADRGMSIGASGVADRIDAAFVESSALNRDSTDGGGSRAGSDIRTMFGNARGCSGGGLIKPGCSTV